MEEKSEQKEVGEVKLTQCTRDTKLTLKERLVVAEKMEEHEVFD